ncbi:ribosomal oxygenase 2-like [Actinia tenebrosa]|uniref:Bifunctional lysine-specific demethylase and histidyl-hydroxylase n=1 Tax=Actinia tenebrosa TaxID=6105 RepID=A0A6P8IYR4_ACTTE|nr:ribosomal oxygenase 2-like [Actinia tenebrosa]
MKRKDRPSSSNATEERRSKKTKKTAEAEDAQESGKLDYSSPEKLFSSLLSPTTAEEFFSEYWEKKPLFMQRKEPEYYGTLFSKSDLDSLLKKEEILFVQDLNLCRYEDGNKEYLNGDINTKATASQVSKEVKERKATIQFHQPQRFKDILWQLNAHLESVFGCLVGANVYITPPDSQGLAPHHDDIEAFVLQLEGKKQWKLYQPKSELAQDYSTDFEQKDIGEPTHEIELQEGDLLYFPRGTIHQAVTPKGSGHSTHLTISTYQQSSWGNLMSSILTDAIDKAMDTDVEFRRGLPINYLNYMGLGMEGDGKAKSKQEDFNNQVKHLLTRLADYVDAHGTTDKVATDFVFNRLPPYEQKVEATRDQGESEKPPTADSKVKFRYPEYVRISVGDADNIPIGVFEAGQDSDDENDEMSEEGEEEPEDESMEESEEEEKPKKKGKSKKETAKQKVKKGKKKQKDESEEEDEEDESEEETKGKAKKGKGKREEKKGTKKSKEKKSKKGKKEEESEEEEEDEEESSEEEKPKSKKGKAKKDAQKKKTEKGKKSKKKSESEDDEDDDEEDKSFDIGEQDTGEDSDDEDESDDDDDEGPWVYVHHSLNNIRASHMMNPQEPSVLKFAISYKDALLHLFHNRYDFIPLKSLPLKEPESLYLITSLWSEGLIKIKD